MSGQHTYFAALDFGSDKPFVSIPIFKNALSESMFIPKTDSDFNIVGFYVADVLTQKTIAIDEHSAAGLGSTCLLPVCVQGAVTLVDPRTPLTNLAEKYPGLSTHTLQMVKRTISEVQTVFVEREEENEELSEDSDFDLNQKLQMRVFRIALSRTGPNDSFFKSFYELCRQDHVAYYSIVDVFGSYDFVVSVWLDANTYRQFSESFLQWAKNSSSGISNLVDVSDFETCHYHWLRVDKQNSVPSGELPGLLNQSALSDLKHGIGFQFFISRGKHSELRARADNAIRKQIVEALRSDKDIRNLEIYEGSSKTWLLIAAHVDHDKFEHISVLRSALYEMNLSVLESRIETLVHSDIEKGVFISEIGTQIAVSPQIRSIDDIQIQALLEGPENEHVEIKASFSVDMRTYFKNGKIEKVREIRESVLKTIVGFLNTAGGTLIVGAIEPQRLSGVDLDSYPEVGEFRVCGIDAELKKRSFDHLSRHITNLVRKRIGASAASHIAISEVILCSRSLMVIQIRRSNEVKYLDDDMYVRQGAATLKLTAREALELSKDLGFKSDL